jgi:hypothetical protein
MLPLQGIGQNSSTKPPQMVALSKRSTEQAVPMLEQPQAPIIFELQWSLSLSPSRLNPAITSPTTLSRELSSALLKAKANALKEQHQR